VVDRTHRHYPYPTTEIVAQRLHTGARRYRLRLYVGENHPSATRSRSNHLVASQKTWQAEVNRL